MKKTIKTPTVDRLKLFKATARVLTPKETSIVAGGAAPNCFCTIIKK